jgi:PAS domain S-box-containing protein
MSRAPAEPGDEERVLLEETLGFLASGSGDATEGFFEQLTRFLARRLRADFVCVDRLPPGQNRAEMLARYSDGEFGEVEIFELSGTPYQEVLDAGIGIFRCGLAQRFPNDRMLQDFGAESYAGIALKGAQQQVIGIIAMMFRRGLDEAGARIVETLLRLVAVRAAAELERLDTEAALRESEARFRSLVELSADWYWEQDAELRFVQVVGSALVGDVQTTTGNRRWEQSDLVDPDDPGWAVHRAQLERREPFRSFEYRVFDMHGGIRWVSVSGHPVFDAKGVFRGYRGTARDVTARRQAVEKQREQLDFIQTLFDALPHPVAVKGLDGRYLHVNLAFARVVGLDRADILGRRIRDVLGDAAGGLHEAMDARLAAAPDQPIEYQLPDQSVEPGEPRYLHHKATFKGPDGVVAGIINLSVDVSALLAAQQALRDSEARFRSLVELSADFYWEQDAQFRYTEVSESLRQRGVPLESLYGKTRWDIPLDGVSAEQMAAHRAQVEAHLPFRDFEYQGFTRRRGPFWMSVSGLPLFDAQGRFTGYRGIGRDITARKDSERQAQERQAEIGKLLQEAELSRHVLLSVVEDQKAEARARADLEAQLRESQKMEAMGTLAGGIAHDFNNIVAAILGNVALASQDLEAGQAQRALVSLQEIGRSGRRARDLVQQILTFSRRQPQHMQVQALAPLLRESLVLLRATVPAGVSLQAELSDEPLYVHADATQIEQVVMNLCTNAWHALEGRPGRVVVGLGRLPPPPETQPAGNGPVLGLGQACITVSDDGRGMDPATQARMFEPFFTTKAVDKGTGLGLAVVHGIVKSHQGSIAVRSAPRRGTTVQVLLPLSPAPEPAQARSAPPARPLARHGQRSVLYVDDDESMTFLVRRILEARGHRVSVFNAVHQALQAVRAAPRDFDLVVTDYNMPGASGLELARELALLCPQLPVLITTGYVTDELVAGAEAAGVRHVVSKPDTIDELCDIVQDLLDRRTA